MEYTVKALAELAGISTRTLRYYDQINLLSPLRTNDAGYRYYGSEQVDRLQQILFYRQLGFPLDEIASLLDDPGFDAQAALQSHLDALKQQRSRLDCLIHTVEKTILHNTGAINMTNQEKFEGFQKKRIQENEKMYGAELRAQYGDEKMDQFNAKMLSLSPEEYELWNTLGEEILAGLEHSVLTGTDPGSDAGKQLAELHRRWLSYSWPHYSPAAHKGLAQMYVADERFTAYYDRHVAGCAAFLRDAIMTHV